jgi:hypothetical protein
MNPDIPVERLDARDGIVSELSSGPHPGSTGIVLLYRNSNGPAKATGKASEGRNKS